MLRGSILGMVNVWLFRAQVELGSRTSKFEILRINGLRGFDVLLTSFWCIDLQVEIRHADLFWFCLLAALKGKDILCP